jgi:hypothetical protein
LHKKEGKRKHLQPWVVSALCVVGLVENETEALRLNFENTHASENIIYV